MSDPLAELRPKPMSDLEARQRAFLDEIEAEFLEIKSDLEPGIVDRNGQGISDVFTGAAIVAAVVLGMSILNWWLSP